MHDAVKNVKKQRYFDQLLQTPNLTVFNFIIQIEKCFCRSSKVKKKILSRFSKKNLKLLTRVYSTRFL